MMLSYFHSPLSISKFCASPYVSVMTLLLPAPFPRVRNSLIIDVRIMSDCSFHIQEVYHAASTTLLKLAGKTIYQYIDGLCALVPLQQMSVSMRLHDCVDLQAIRTIPICILHFSLTVTLL